LSLARPKDDIQLVDYSDDPIEDLEIWVHVELGSLGKYDFGEKGGDFHMADYSNVSETKVGSPITSQQVSDGVSACQMPFLWLADGDIVSYGSCIEGFKSSY
jgi:hypothetical protein